MSKTRTIVIHPILFALFPVLALYANNIKIVPAGEIILPIAITVLLTMFFWLLSGLALKNYAKAGIIVSLFLILFFSYGHLYNSISGFRFSLNGLIVGPIKLIFTLFGAIFVLGAFFCIKTRKKPLILTDLLNVVAITLVIVSLTYIASYKLRAKSQFDVKIAPVEIAVNIDHQKMVRPPNIYYIIVDGYARQDVLRDVYNYDNSDFIDFLIKKGFYVADRSMANYSQTDLSVASSLNMDYLDHFIRETDKNNGDRKIMGELVKENTVLRFLKKQGYATIAFSTGWYGTEIRNADLYIDLERANLFQNELINTTPLPHILIKLAPPGQNMVGLKYRLLHALKLFSFDSGYDLHRRSILDLFNDLEKKAEREPCFVFAHIICPHPPFVFGPHGEEVNLYRKFTLNDGSSLVGTIPRQEYIREYRDQLEFTNKKLKKSIEAILSNYSDRAMIILQADHGPGVGLDHENVKNTNLNERMSILNAYYFPGNDYSGLYPSISPVNTFRLILDRYFGADYNLLEDKSYFSTWTQPYKFVDVAKN